MLKKITSVFMALVVLVMTSGFSVSKHICGGEMVKSSIQFTRTALSCGMEQVNNTCSDDNTISKNCCKNEFEQFILDENGVEETLDQEKEAIIFVALYQLVSEWNLLDKKKVDSFIDYSPPPLVLDIPTFIQSYLI